MSADGVPLLEVAGVTKSYGERSAALEAVSFTVRRGEFVSIVGPSGCGKSTLLAMVAGLLRPDEGRISVAGAHVTGPGRDRAMVFQDAALMPWLNVRHNVEYGLRAQRVPKAERRTRVEEAIEMVHLSHVADRRPHELSGGMRQRVAIARALVLRPEILLMDEPFSALDAQTRTVLQDELQRIWIETRPAVLFITHNLLEAAFLSDTIHLLSTSPGRIVQSYEVGVERPRDEGDPRLVAIRQDMMGRLRSEVAAGRASLEDDPLRAPVPA